MGRVKKPSPSLVINSSLSGAIEIKPIQVKMMDFYAENPRCVIHAPRQVGKTVFLAMQALMSNHYNTLIILPTSNMVTIMKDVIKDICDNNNITYTFNREIGKATFTIGGYHIVCCSRYMVDTPNIDVGNFDEVMIDEFYYMDMNIPLLNHERVILIGTNVNNREPNNMHVEVTGIFAGLNINED